MVPEAGDADLPAVTERPTFIRVLSKEERRRFVREVYRLLAQPGKPVTYTKLHATVRQLQPTVEKRFGIRLGYAFDSESFYGPIDRTLQEDLDVLDARGLVDNHDFVRDGIVSHSLGPTTLGEDLANSDGFIEGRRYFFGASRGEFQKVLKAALEGER